jgi:dolichyl-phosphate-mannose--protein O-mannosyl transferase
VKLPPPGRGRDLVLALLLTLAAAAFRIPRLGTPPEEIFDEVYHAVTAREYLTGEYPGGRDQPTEWVHPPTAKLLIAIGVKLFGYNAFGWRILPALAGIALTPVFFLLARTVLQTERAALLATILLLGDGVYLVQSRTAMTNIFAVLFQVGAAVCIVRAGRADRLPVREMAAAGFFLGLALSTRWTSLWATGFVGLVLLVLRGKRILRLREIGLVALAFLVLPSTLYVLSYVPWMLQGGGHTLADVVHKQGEIWRYHATLNASHPYFSKWTSWPWLTRPTWYYFHQEGDQSTGTVYGIIALGNPALWWVSVPVTVWALASGLLARDPRRLFTGLGFCALYLPWGISPRTLNYSHYLFEAIPYACLSLGMLLDRAWDGWGRTLARGYVAAVLALFVFFYPFLAALPVPAALFYQPLGSFSTVRLWTWFPGWI